MEWPGLLAQGDQGGKRGDVVDRVCLIGEGVRLGEDAICIASGSIWDVSKRTIATKALKIELKIGEW